MLGLTFVTIRTSRSLYSNVDIVREWGHLPYLQIVIVLNLNNHKQADIRPKIAPAELEHPHAD